jgi:hypothetical protein
MALLILCKAVGRGIMAIDERNIEIIDDVVAKILKEKTPQQRLAIAFNLWTSARKQLSNYLRAEHPDWSDSKIQKEVAKRLSHGTV